MVQHLTAAPFGCGRDRYIFMRAEVHKGKSGMTKEPKIRYTQATFGQGIAIAHQRQRDQQRALGDRLSSPSPRQLRISNERYREYEHVKLRDMEFTTPFLPGWTLEQRRKAIHGAFRRGDSLEATIRSVPGTPTVLKCSVRPRSVMSDGGVGSYGLRV